MLAALNYCFAAIDVIRGKEDGTVENEVKGFVNMSLDILYTTSINLAGVAQLVKAISVKRVLLARVKKLMNRMWIYADCFKYR